MPVPARMIPDPLRPTVVAPIDVTTHVRGTAVEEMGDDPALIGPKGVGVLIIADVFSENIRYLQFRFLWFNHGGHRRCPPLV
jgi:hypothetical protein